MDMNPAQTAAYWERLLVHATRLGDFLTTFDGTADDGLAAIHEAKNLVEQAQRGLRLAVAYSRDKGASWDDIGATLGVSKQAAQQRFGVQL